MRKILLSCLAVAALAGCSITPPGSLAEAKRRHAEEIESLNATLGNVRAESRKTKSELDACKVALENELAYRTYDARAVAYMQWCDALGLAFGMCNDRLYTNGVGAHERGESASWLWQVSYFGLSLLAAGLAIAIAVSIPLKIWLQARRNGALRLLETIRTERERLTSFSNSVLENIRYWNRLADSLEELKRDLRRNHKIAEHARSHLEFQLSKTRAARAELLRLRRLRDTLDF